MTPLASIIIPSHNHARYLPDAIESALAQTVPVEVIVVDDGSTDATPDVTATYSRRARTIRQEHAGVAAARNRGIEAARSPFVMFLDADDVIAPAKVERQLAAFMHGLGWVLCDVRIEFESGAVDTASNRYGYAGMDLHGDIAPLLELRNFIPVMAPLVRAEIFEAIRFPDGKLEDWSLWRQVAAVARVAYVPEVLATYRRRREGRHNEDNKPKRRRK